MKLDLKEWIAKITTLMPCINSTASDGTSTWNVKKYPNGDCEIWAKISRAMSSQGLWTNGHYAGNFTQALPSGIFTSVSYAIVQVHTYGIMGWGEPTTTSLKVYYTIDSPNISVTQPVLMKVVGKWK